MSLASQVCALTASGLRNIPHRLGNSLVVVVGIGGVVAVLIPVFALYLGFRATIRGDGRADRAIVLSRAATTEYESSLSRESVAIVANAPGVRHDARGDPLVSAEIVLAAPVARKRDDSDVSITLRGVGPQYFAMRPELKLVAGRMFRPGNQELVVGAAAQSQFAGLEIGDRVRLQNGDWTVVGVFAGGNGARQSELIADAGTVMSAYKLDDFNSMTVRLDSPRALPAFDQALGRDSRLLVSAVGEPEYLANASASVNRMLRFVAYTVGSIMALGAVFAALNSTYSSVANRTVEIATLRAFGFGAGAIALSILLETSLLALVGAAIGISLAYAAFQGSTVTTLGGALFDSQLVYSLSVTPTLIASAAVLAWMLGLFGGLQPAVRAGRRNIAVALQEM